MWSQKLTAFALLVLLVEVNWALPKCDRNDEDCRDRLMHPDLPEPEQPRRRAIDGEDTTQYWRALGRDFVRQQLSKDINRKQAKNVIMFLGDGMGLTTVAAARNLLGGEEKQLSFNEFPFTGLSKTYSVDKIVPDSACTATAYLCGVKAQEGTIGVNGDVERSNCEKSKDSSKWVHSIAKWAQDEGKSTGVVTTTRITHASPAGVYAHIADRDWENDVDVEKDCNANSGVQDIAYQLINGDVGKKLNFIMGGGRANFRDVTQNGWRKDGLDLIDQYKKQANSKNLYVETKEELMAANLKEYNRVMGLYQDNHMLYHLETNEETSSQPTLEEMTRKAIEFLSQNDKGYFVFIEGGRIDLAHHANMARIALDETLEFSKAIAAAKELTNEQDTLIVVTADHSHAFSFSGYPYRGTDIFGKAPATSDDKKPYMTLSYANGPSFERFFDVQQSQRRDPTALVTGDIYDSYPSSLPLEDETHGGDDVAVYASGPWSHLFTGVYEQNAIPHMMAYAACLGDGLKMCPRKYN